MLKIYASNVGSVSILCLQGRLMRGKTEALRREVESQLQASEILLDLRRVSVIDAGGLGVLLELRQWARSKEIEFGLVNVSGLVRRVLEITRLDSVFEISTRLNIPTGATRRRGGSINGDRSLSAAR